MCVKDGHRRKVGEPNCRLDMAETHAQLRVTFPSITTKASPTRAFDFLVTCQHRTSSVVTVAREYRVFSPGFCMSEVRDAGDVACDFALSDIPRNCRAEIRFVVTPCDCWENPGAPLASEWMKVEDLVK